MLKHIITTKCIRDCSYCITKNVKTDEYFSEYKLANIYSEALDRGHSKIMLTGGEPTIYKHFNRIVRIASLIFDEVYLTTANPEVLNTPMTAIKAVTYSMHDEASMRSRATSGNTIYASMMNRFYNPYLPLRLKHLGFAGLTINEDRREDSEFSELVPVIKNFSIRINRKGKYMDETIILPNYEIVNDFTPFM